MFEFEIAEMVECGVYPWSTSLVLRGHIFHIPLISTFLSYWKGS